jgi:hypothetical protein
VNSAPWLRNCCSYRHVTRQNVVKDTTRCALSISFLRISSSYAFVSSSYAFVPATCRLRRSTRALASDQQILTELSRPKQINPELIRHQYPVAVHRLVRHALLHSCPHHLHHSTMSRLVYHHHALPLTASTAQLHCSLDCKSHTYRLSTVQHRTARSLITSVPISNILPKARPELWPCALAAYPSQTSSRTTSCPATHAEAW